jgi:type IV secretion system protein VirB11
MTAIALPVYLRSYLAPLAPMLERVDVTDIFVNRPGEIWVETTTGALEQLAVPELDENALWRLARQIASLSSQGISREHPLLSATLPGGERVQIVAPPATRGALAIAVRKHVVADLELADYEKYGAFDAVQLDGPSASETLDLSLSALLQEGKVTEFLRLAVRCRKNIVVSGGTATGKTTFVNALLKEVPRQERLVLIEDAPEIRITHPNSLGLVSVRGELGEAQITTDHLVQASLRLRPDRIILGEIRGPEAASFLRAVNTGHPGSITTIHADSPRGAVDQLSLLALQAGLNIERAELCSYIRSNIDVFVQLTRLGGARVISEIAFRDFSNQPR